MSVIGGQSMSVFVIAQSNCKVLEIPEKFLWKFNSSDLNFTKNLMMLFMKCRLGLNHLLYQHKEDSGLIKAEINHATDLYNNE